MRRVAAITILMCAMAFGSCFRAEAREPYWDQHHIDLSGLPDAQTEMLEKTLARLISLQPGELKMSKSAYRRLSRFQALFGFSFDGKKLLDWLLRRMERVSYHNSRTAALNQNKGSFIVGNLFFNELSDWERLYTLIHEARHSDDDGYDHVKCPKGFKYISSRQPDMDLVKEPACDDNNKGAYAFQAAFLFELFAYGLFDQSEVGLLYNSSISRVIPRE